MSARSLSQDPAERLKCFECRLNLDAKLSFSATQRKKGHKRRCQVCVGGSPGMRRRVEWARGGSV